MFGVTVGKGFKGFQATFESGYTLVVRWDSLDFDSDSEKAEVAVIDKAGLFVTEITGPVRVEDVFALGEALSHPVPNWEKVHSICPWKR